MFGIFVGIFFSSISMWICRLLGAIPDQWNWWYFGLGIVVYARIRVIIYRSGIKFHMESYLAYLDDSPDGLKFDAEQKLLLISASGIILPPKMLTMGFNQVEMASLSGLCEIINIILFTTSLFYREYHIVIITILVFISGYGFWLWQPNFFYSGNRRMDNMSTLLLYLKAKGENIKTIDESKLKEILTTIYSTLVLFNMRYEKDQRYMVDILGGRR